MPFNLLLLFIFPIGQACDNAFQCVTFPCGNAFLLFFLLHIFSGGVSLTHVSTPPMSSPLWPAPQWSLRRRKPPDLKKTFSGHTVKLSAKYAHFRSQSFSIFNLTDKLARLTLPKSSKIERDKCVFSVFVFSLIIHPSYC